MHDLIYCFRMLRKRPSFTVVAVLTLALAIGASTALFSIVNVVVLNPFAYKDPSRLFFVRQSLPKIGVQDQFRVSGPEFVDIAKSGIFERVAAFESVSRNLTGSDEPERVSAAKVSTEFFTMLGVEPLIGRTIAPNEQGPNGQRVLVISHGLWQRRFGGDKAVLGQKVSLDDEPFTIIGVMPPQFRFEEQQAWFPFPFDFAETQRAGRSFAIMGRTTSATSQQQVNAALANLARQNEQDFASTNQEYVGRAIFVQPLAEFYFGPVRKALFILLGAVGMVLLIACANIAGPFPRNRDPKRDGSKSRAHHPPDADRKCRVGFTRRRLRFVDSFLGHTRSSHADTHGHNSGRHGCHDERAGACLHVSRLARHRFPFRTLARYSRIENRNTRSTAIGESTNNCRTRNSTRAECSCRRRSEPVANSSGNGRFDDSQFCKTDEYRSGDEHRKRHDYAHQSIASEVKRRLTECDLFSNCDRSRQDIAGD